VGRGFGLWKILYKDKLYKLYGLTRINGQDKNGGFESMEYTNIGKGQAGIARKGVFCGCVWYAIYFNKREGGLFKGTHIFG
jgi:hypothetical protein